MGSSGPDTAVGSDRNPFTVWVLSIVTLGIYFFYWYYQVNTEIGRHDTRVKANPGLSLLAVLLSPFTLGISALISVHGTAARLQRMEQAEGVAEPINPLLATILLFFFGIGYYYQVQGHLNAHWARHRGASAGLVSNLGQAQAAPAPAPKPPASVAPEGTTAGSRSDRSI